MIKRYLVETQRGAKYEIEAVSPNQAQAIVESAYMGKGDEVVVVREMEEQ